MSESIILHRIICVFIVYLVSFTLFCIRIGGIKSDIKDGFTRMQGCSGEGGQVGVLVALLTATSQTFNFDFRCLLYLSFRSMVPWCHAPSAARDNSRFPLLRRRSSEFGTT